ncbi:TPA: hypothetical protein N0F65_009148, partial [Lagenidium giganteum]
METCQHVVDLSLKTTPSYIAYEGRTYLLIDGAGRTRKLTLAQPRQDRALQSDSFTTIPPPVFTDGTVAYYGCSYSGDWQSWCCNQVNTGKSGSTCWDLNTCGEEYQWISGQNLICCTTNPTQCIPTYDKPMPTPAPTTPTPTPPRPTTAPPTTAPPTTAPPTTAPPTTAPPTKATPTTAPPTTAPPTTAPPTTAPPTTAPPTTAP